MEPIARPRAARARWILVTLVACAAGVLALLGLSGLSGGLGRGARPVEPARPAEAVAPGRGTELVQPAPAVAPVLEPPRADARTAGTEGRRDGSRVELLALAPAEWPLTTPVTVAVRRRSGELEREIRLAPDAPQADLVLADGEYVLDALHPGPPELASLPLVLVVDGDAAESVRLALVPMRVLAGTVTDESGRAIVDVPLALELGDSPAATARTGVDGGFAFAPLAEGEYELLVGDPLGPIVPRRTVRLGGAMQLLEVVVPPLLDAVVRVVDEQGLALPDAEVEGVGESGGRIAGVTDARGELHARGLPPGNYRVFARDPVLGRGTKSFTLSSSTPAQPVEIRLVPRR